MSKKHNPKTNRLLIISTTLTGGGAERFVSTLLAHYDRNFFSAHLVLVRADTTYPVPEDVKTTCLGKETPWQHFRVIRRLHNLIEKEKPDIVLSNLTYTGLLASAALFRCKHQPIWIARIAAPPTYTDTFWIRGLCQILLRRANQLVTISEGLKNDFTNRYPFSEGKTIAIYNATDFSYIDKLSEATCTIKKQQDIPIIIFVGRLDREKRPDLLIRTFKFIIQNMRAELWIFGDGQLRNRLDEEIKEDDLKDSVRLFGFQDNPFSAMKIADLFLLTSDFEGLSYSLIEAQGLGLPAVSTDCPFGPREIITPGETGILSRIGDPKSLADDIQTILLDSDLHNNMAYSARKNARRRFDISKIIPQWHYLFRELLADRGPVQQLPQSLKD